MNRRVIGWIVVLMVGFGLGVSYERLAATEPAPAGSLRAAIDRILTRQQNGADPGVFEAVSRTIDQEFVESGIDETKQYYGAIRGYVDALGDPYSSFFDPETTADFKEGIGEAHFSGIGAEIGAEESMIVVIAPLPDSPAERAGVKAGDQILQVDETDTIGKTVDEVVTLIRGPEGSQVKLLIVREKEQPTTITITRQQIRVESVRWELKQTPRGQSVAYVQISHFTEETASLFEQAITEFLLKQPVSVVLDLRNNPGGYLQSAIEMAGEFVDDGTPIISERHRTGEPRVLTSQGTPRLKGRRMYLLVNEGSASASEILAGAMQDYSVATVIGEKTFGKGSVQTLDEFPDGSSLKLTVARWFTPKGRTIHNEGITPDVMVKDDRSPDKDPVLEEALKSSDTQP